MHDPLIRAEIDRRTALLLDRYGITAERVLNELAKIAFSTAVDVFDEDGKPLRPQDVPLEVAAAIKSYRVDSEGQASIEMHDKLAALRHLGSQYGLFTERVEVNAGEALVKAIREARERTRLSGVVLEAERSAADATQPSLPQLPAGNRSGR